jgi:hypothetical protein
VTPGVGVDGRWVTVQVWTKCWQVEIGSKNSLNTNVFLYGRLRRCSKTWSHGCSTFTPVRRRATQDNPVKNKDLRAYWIYSHQPPQRIKRKAQFSDWAFCLGSPLFPTMVSTRSASRSVTPCRPSLSDDLAAYAWAGIAAAPTARHDAD